MIRSSIEDRFGREFRRVLKGKFDRIPSAAFVASQLHRQTGVTDGFSAESVRRWMRGQSMPRYEHLELLVQWLDLNLDRVVNPIPADKARFRDSPFVDAFASLQPELQENILRFVGSIPMLGQQMKLSEQLRGE